MSARMKKHKKELCFLAKCTKAQRKTYLNTSSNALIGAISDASKTLLEGNLPISNYFRKKLRRNITLLKKLANNKISVKQKRTALKKQSGGNILESIWKVISNLF